MTLCILLLMMIQPQLVEMKKSTTQIQNIQKRLFMLDLKIKVLYL